MLGPLTEKVARHKGNLAAVVLGQAASMAGLAVGIRILTEYASTETFGTAKLLIGLVVLLVNIAVRPFNQFAMREYHDSVVDASETAFLSYARRAQLILSALLALFLLAGLLVYTGWSGELAVLTCFACAVMFLGETGYNLERSIFVTRGKQLSASLLDASRQWGLPLLTAVAIMLVSDTPEVFLSAQALILCCIVWGYRLGPGGWRERDACGPERALVRGWNEQARRFILPMLPLGVFQWVVNIGDRYIMAQFLGVGDVGRYAAVYGLVSAPMLALGSISTRFLIPFFFREAAHERTGRWRLMQLGIVVVSLGISVAAVLGVALLGELVANLLLAEEYRQGARLLMIWLAAGHGLLITAYAFDMEAYAGKRTGRMTVSYGAAAALNIGMNLLLIPRMGAVGAAQATFATFALYLAAMVVFSFRARSGTGA